jgi:hypothetical protein
MTLRLTSPQAAMVEEGCVDARHRRLEVSLDHAVQLDGLPRGDPQRAVAVAPRDAVECEPLRGREHAARNAHAQHEGECLLHLLLAALAAQVAVVLEVHAVEFHQLLVVLDDRACDLLVEPLGKRPAQIVARLLDAFVARGFLGHGGPVQELSRPRDSGAYNHRIISSFISFGSSWSGRARP